jgi:hypothetical protein
MTKTDSTNSPATLADAQPVTAAPHCNQCAALVINGVFCHETGCPNSRKTWMQDDGEWVRFLECFECGCDVREGECCDCQEGAQ